MVYLIQHSNSNIWKIGRTTNFQQRFNRLLLFNPHIPNKIVQINTKDDDSDIELERYLHNLLEDYRLHSEWFSISQKRVDDIINSVKLHYGLNNKAIKQLTQEDLTEYYVKD